MANDSRNNDDLRNNLARCCVCIDSKIINPWSIQVGTVAGPTTEELEVQLDKRILQLELSQGELGMNSLHKSLTAALTGSDSQEFMRQLLSIVQRSHVELQPALRLFGLLIARLPLRPVYAWNTVSQILDKPDFIEIHGTATVVVDKYSSRRRP